MCSPDAETYFSELFYWVFVSLIQIELDEFRIWWNQHRVRFQADKNMPSGHIPDDALEHPQFHGGLKCLIPVPKEALDEIRSYLTEEVGPREAHLSWYSYEFSASAQDAYEAVGSPEISLNTAWDVFYDISNILENHM
jgi:hypothetical protein